MLVDHVVELGVTGASAGWGGCGGCGDGWASLMRCRRWMFVATMAVAVTTVTVKIDGREATVSTGRGGNVKQERNSVSDYVLS